MGASSSFLAEPCKVVLGPKNSNSLSALARIPMLGWKTASDPLCRPKAFWLWNLSDEKRVIFGLQNVIGRRFKPFSRTVILFSIFHCRSQSLFDSCETAISTSSGFQISGIFAPCGWNMAAMVVPQNAVKNWEKSGKDEVYVYWILDGSILYCVVLIDVSLFFQLSAV